MTIPVTSAKRNIKVISPVDFSIEEYLDEIFKGMTKPRDYPVIVFLAGASGTGKTTLANKMLEIARKKYSAEFYPSIIRDFYASHRISNEKEMLNSSPERQRAFQSLLLDYYIGRTWDRIMDARKQGVELMIFDRSIFDHIGYASMVGVTIDNSLITNSSRLLNVDFNVLFIPYPQPWNDQTQDSDGFRDSSYPKNIMLSNSIRYHLASSGALQEHDIL